MERIVTSLMFVGDQCGRAEEAMELYVDLFPGSRILRVERFGDDEEGSGVKHARFEILGREFSAMDSGGPHEFTFTPAMSLTVEFGDDAVLRRAFDELSESGAVLMPLADYGFSPLFGWVNDRFGVSWQLTLSNES